MQNDVNTSKEEQKDAIKEEKQKVEAEETVDKSNQEEEKTYDEAYVQELQTQIETLKSNQQVMVDKAVAEALKLNGMSEEEKEAYEKTKQEVSISEREAALARRELEADAKELLEKAGLSINAIPLVLGKDLEETKNKIAVYKQNLDSNVQEQVAARLNGKTPERGTGIDVNDNARALQSAAAEFAKAFE